MASAKRRRYSWPWKILVVLTLALVCFRQGGTWVAPGKASPVGHRPPRSRVLRRSWNVGPLGPVESAEAFRIYYLPFVEPLDIDGTIIDQLFGGWFGPFAPLLVGAVVFWIQGQIYAVRREQEGRVLGSAAKAVGDAAAATASGAAQSLTEKLQRVPAEQWLKLFLCLALDLAGDATFLLPGLGEVGDVAFAPFEALALRTLFGGTVISVVGFVEEALPFTDALPTATTGWVLQTLFSDSPLAKFLGIQPLPMNPETEKGESKGDSKGESKDTKKT
eukprot:s311_g21.t1